MQAGLAVRPLRGAREALNVAQIGPIFRAERTAAVAILGATFTKVTLNVKAYDTASAFDAAINYRFKPTTAGYYHFDGTVTMTNTSAAQLTNAAGYLYKNGSIAKTLGQIGLGAAAGASFITLSGSGSVFLNGSSDYVELWSYGDVSAGGLTMMGSLEGYFVRP